MHPIVPSAVTTAATSAVPNSEYHAHHEPYVPSLAPLVNPRELPLTERDRLFKERLLTQLQRSRGYPTHYYRSRADIGWTVVHLYYGGPNGAGCLMMPGEDMARTFLDQLLGPWLQEQGLRYQLHLFDQPPPYAGLVVFEEDGRAQRPVCKQRGV